MAGKKKEGLAGLKGTSGGLRRDDRLATSKSIFETITIDAKNALTVVYMLQSPEENVVLKAIASLEIFGHRSEENLQLLSSLGILPFVLPLIRSSDTATKRFAQKLVGLLCSLEEFRDQILKVDNVLTMLVDILDQEADVVMHEFSALSLAELTKEYEGASALLNVKNCIPTLFQRVASLDPDVQKNCLDVMSHLLNDIYGIDHFVECPQFEIKQILALIPSSYQVIQTRALEVLMQLLNWRRDTRILFAFRDASGIECVLSVLENQEWADLHGLALDILVNVLDSPDLCEFLLQTGCLVRFINLLDTVDSGPPIEKILGVLGRIALTQKGRESLHKLEVVRRFCSYLNARVDEVLEPCCLGIANVAQYIQSLDIIMAENPIPQLMEILSNGEKKPKLRNIAAYALNVLATEDKRAAERLLRLEKFDSLCEILKETSLPSELRRNIIHILNGIGAYEYLRTEVATENVIGTLMSCLESDGKFLGTDLGLEVDALECLSSYLVELKAQIIFNELAGAEKVIECMKSKYSSVREWAGQLVTVTSQNKEFVKMFIKHGGLNWLIEQKTTRRSMPSWDSATEAIFAAFLPAKFSFTGRLDIADITENGFYVMSRPSKKFLPIEEYLENLICPLHPIYIANFEEDPTECEMESDEETNSVKSTHSDSKLQKRTNAEEPEEPVKNPAKYMKGSDRNSGEVYKWTGSVSTYPSVDYQSSSAVLDEAQLSERFGRCLPDPYLGEYVAKLKKKVQLEQSQYGDGNWFCIHPKLVLERTRTIAEFVAEEMSGFEPNPLCVEYYKRKSMNEMKLQLGTTIFPLGYVRTGDYLERAMLFKVLADRIGFPCAMVRGPYGRAWIEIAVPVINIEEPEECSIFPDPSGRIKNGKLEEAKVEENTSIVKQPSKGSVTGEECFWYPKLQMECFKAFPTHFLKPNSIVDLIDVPGRVFKMNSREADEYCGVYLFARN